MKKHLIFAAALLTLAACNNEEYDPADDPNTPMEIRLSSGIEVQTRTTHNLDTQLGNGELVHVWVDDAGTGNEEYKDNVLTADGNGRFTGGTDMYFPQTGNTVNIYAVHGNFTKGTDWSEAGFWDQEITHTVAENQCSDPENNGYALSDLVYAKKANAARTKEDINLEFTHLLSKVEVVLVQGAGVPVIKSAEILNTKLDAQFTPNKEGNFSVTASGATGENPIQIDVDLTKSSDAKGDDESKKKLNEAIIVPQKLAAGTDFIRIITLQDGELIYTLPAEQTFDPAKRYRYTVTANLTELTVTSSIEEWGNGGGNSGNAEMK